jgi:organic hydroperoxide reductase OsmC/OhrA
MSEHEHTYRVRVTWIGNRGAGTRSYREYGREHAIAAPGKPDIPGSSDPAFRGDAARWSPEDLLVAAASACHKLWYLHLCADAGIVVTAYEDDATGTMQEGPERGAFTGILLRPRVTLASGDPAVAVRLHQTAHRRCYIANSVTFPIACEPTISVSG